MDTVLVTGGLGFIGSHTVVRLLENNFEVIILDSEVNSSKQVLNRIEKLLNYLKLEKFHNLNFINGDVRDEKLLDKIFTSYHDAHKKISAVIHYAGYKYVEKSFIAPLSFWENNVSGTISLLKTMDRNQCRTIVFSSSASIYSPANLGTIKENDVISPISPYGNTKATIEKILNDLFSFGTSKWKVANLRYFNPIGAHSSGFIGDDPVVKSTNVFPSLLDCCFDNSKTFYINGNDWKTRDGTCVRDFIHVEDLADSHIKVLEKLLKKEQAVNLNLNIGTGKGVSILELVKTFEKTNKVKIKYAYAERRVGDYSYLVADNSFAFEKLNWKPKRNLQDMCRDGFNWYKKSKVFK